MTQAIPEFAVQDLTAHALYLEERWHSPKGRAIREIVFGGNDGLVTPLGLLLGVYRVHQDPGLLLIVWICVHQKLMNKECPKVLLCRPSRSGLRVLTER